MFVIFLSFNFIVVKLLVVVIVTHAPVVFDGEIGIVEALLGLHSHKVVRFVQVNLIFYIVLHDFDRVLQMGTVFRHGHLGQPHVRLF